MTKITGNLGEELGLGVNHGVLDMEVIPEGPADRAGLRGGTREVILGDVRFLLGGDVITVIYGQPVSGMDQPVGILIGMEAGQRITLGVYRDRAPLDIQVG